MTEPIHMSYRFDPDRRADVVRWADVLRWYGSNGASDAARVLGLTWDGQTLKDGGQSFIPKPDGYVVRWVGGERIAFSVSKEQLDAMFFVPDSNFDRYQHIKSTAHAWMQEHGSELIAYAMRDGDDWQWYPVECGHGIAEARFVPPVYLRLLRCQVRLGEADGHNANYVTPRGR